jgi:predicted aspartyl protease
MWKRAMLAAALAAAAPPAHADGGQCRLALIASLPVRPDAAGRPRIPVRIDGRDRQFIVDTGGVSTMITADTARELGLSQAPVERSNFIFINGDVAAGAARARSFHIGPIAVGAFTFLVTPPSIRLPDAAGALGPDIMRHFDVEFDFARNRVNLFAPNRCQGRAAYWTSRPAATMSFTLDDSGHLSAAAMLDGKLVDILIDTGAGATVMTLEDAESEFGIVPGSSGVVLHFGGPDPTYAYRFGALHLEGVTIERPEILLRRDQTGTRNAALRPELILGMRELSQLHLYVAYGEGKIYLTNAGDR